jgi:hypothetical protein
MRQLIKWYSGLNIYYRLIPFLLLYLSICLFLGGEDLGGDEPRYLMFANNLLHGFYSPPYPDINLWNGPGYPMFITLFMFFNFPLLALRLLNVFFLYFSLIISYKTFSQFLPERKSYLFTLLLGLYFPILQMISVVLTECLAWFLISLICFLFIKTYQQKSISWKYIFLTALSIAYLAMTKIIFGYVILFMLFVSLLMIFLPEFRASAKKSTLIFFISFVFCLPWLLYTYSLTNKPFYWGNSGNMSLYTMSTPYEGESGQWFDEDQLIKNPNHTAFIDSILKLTPLQRDNAYKTAAINNIKNHPKKYIANWISNTGRLLFFPSSYAPQTLLSYHPFIPNMFALVFIVMAMAVSIVHYKKLPQVLIFLLLFILIYLFNSLLVSTYRRVFYITIPFWLLFISFVFNNIVSIKINKKSN